MSGCESPPANLRQTKVSQILHGLASDPLTGLLFCRRSLSLSATISASLPDSAPRSSPPAVTPVKVCVPQSQSVVAIFYCWCCTKLGMSVPTAAKLRPPFTLKLTLYSHESPFFCDVRRIILRITLPPTGISAQNAPCDPEVTWVNQQLRYRRLSVGNSP
ncbi:hypothetical protein ABZX51_005148 [Aspergillus tubingensis]|uniref:Uncharacterized protein n=1 Tax=Aspergillus tubingensis (strain CBS 134.48) TaxID=767770 RepID=A0A1L9NM43_ASPTC|nr:aldehyde dehydrogenase family protein [Aspergillus tubingensis]OJI90291.1 hypothetical protein ASPTUDRAFT_186144 [Aspergillus tubingensis CBS 134.48]GFN10421.1 aldehyde dehydrogenase family protein [Aspergillus tubingensis]